MNKNSNTYIILYSTVMVVIVAFILAFAAMSLKSKQQANILNEKQQAILSSLGAADQDYDSYITAYAVDAEGQLIEGVEGVKVLDLLKDLKGSMENETFPVFESKDGRLVLPVYGAGLWGPIWGYVALGSDLNTISGIVIDHKGETPGLGAEVATPKHQAMYVGKKIFNGDEFVSVSLIKGGVKPGSDMIDHQVDAITGGTKTSDGVTAMLKQSIQNYLPLLAAKRTTEVSNK